MYLTLCFNQATRRVAFVEAPEAFIQVVLELGSCNLGALTALLEAATGAQASTDSTGNGVAGGTPLAKLTSALGGQHTTPAPMSYSKFMDLLLSAVNPGHALKQLLLSAVGPGEDLEDHVEERLLPVRKPWIVKVSKTVLRCTSVLEGDTALFLAPACCPFCSRMLRRRCFPQWVSFLPQYQGQEDLDSDVPIYSCEACCDVFSNKSGALCPQCSKGKLTKRVQDVVREEGSFPAQSLPTESFKPGMSLRKCSVVMPVVKRMKDEKLCLLTDELEPLNPQSVVGVLQIMRTSGVLFSAEETSAVSVDLGCKEILALAKLARLPGQKEVFSTIFADVLVAS